MDANPLPPLLRCWRYRVLSLLLLLLLLSTVAGAADPLEIKVSGVSGEEALANVRAALVFPPGLIENGQVELMWLERFEEQLPERVRKALEPFGYYEAEVSIQRQVTAPGRYQLEVTVLPGEAVHVTSVAVRLSGPGESAPRLQRLIADFPLQVGEVLRQDLYDQAKGTLKARVLDRGYLDADFK
ncbi:MAG: POTRA domain-containing protein, partial [Desulfuromonadales bacterium]|nr:POTRA domain-containing protein [Desulfuromonadales bacterium]